MKIKETFSQGLKREFDITIPATEIEKKLNTRLEALNKKVNIPGFRPGKIPLDIMKKRYKASVLSEVMEDCVEKGLEKIIKEKNLKLSLKPQVNIKSFEEDKDLDLEIKMEVLPVIGEINLDNLSFEKYVVEVPPKAVTNIIENIAKKNRKTRPIKQNRKSKKGDILIIDFEGFVEDEPIEGGAGKAHPLELGSNSFIPGFEEQLIGHSKENHVTVNVTFPDDYHEGPYANKPARFEVLIKDIHEADPISIDEALAQKLGFESLEGMQKFVQQKIVDDYTSHCFMNTKRHVLDALAERFVFDVPENMVKAEFDNIWAQLLYEMGIDKKGASNSNLKTDEKAKSFEKLAGKSEEELKNEYTTIAERRVRLGILLAEIGNRHNISITNQELANALLAKVKEFPGQEKEAFDFYRKTPNAMDSLRAPLFENKVVDYILSLSKVKEKKATPEELDKLLSHEEEEAEKKIASQSNKIKKTTKKKEKV